MPVSRGGEVKSVRGVTEKKIHPPCSPPTAFCALPCFGERDSRDQDGGLSNSTIEIYDLTEK